MNDADLWVFHAHIRSYQRHIRRARRHSDQHSLGPVKGGQPEKRALSRMAENNFYPHSEAEQPSDDIAAMMQQLQQNPDLTRQLLQNLLLGAAQAQGRLQCAVS